MRPFALKHAPASRFDRRQARQTPGLAGPEGTEAAATFLTLQAVRLGGRAAPADARRQTVFCFRPPPRAPPPGSRAWWLGCSPACCAGALQEGGGSGRAGRAAGNSATTTLAARGAGTCYRLGWRQRYFSCAWERDAARGLRPGAASSPPGPLRRAQRFSWAAVAVICGSMGRRRGMCGSPSPGASYLQYKAHARASRCDGRLRPGIRGASRPLHPLFHCPHCSAPIAPLLALLHSSHYGPPHPVPCRPGPGGHAPDEQHRQCAEDGRWHRLQW